MTDRLPVRLGKQLARLFGGKPREKGLVNRLNGLKTFVDYQSSGGQPPFDSTNLERLRITWVIPDFLPGAGGHMTIFRIARYLESFGHDVSFLIQNPSVHKSGDAARQTINTHFQPFSGRVELFNGATPTAEGDALIATDRYTCYPVKAMDRFVRKFYFVQDYEPYFYARGAEWLLTEATYRFDFDCLCAGDWLHRIMSETYGRWSVSWPLAFDPTVYNLDGAGARSSNRIALYARYVTPRRAVELAIMALDILARRGVEFEVDFFGWDLGEMDLPYAYRSHGVLSGPKLAELYRQAAVGVVFSATNHSLVNKEMMACGLPVIDLDLENVRAIFPDDAMAFAAPSPEGIADKMQELLAGAGLRDTLRAGGLTYISDLSWEKSARIVEAALRERVGQQLRGGGQG